VSTSAGTYGFEAPKKFFAGSRPPTLALQQKWVLRTRCALVSKDFLIRLKGYGLTTAEIHYRIPDHPKLLQLYVWQEYDLAPLFPGLKAFLEYWQKELEGALHSVRVAHNQLVKPSEWKAVDGVFRLN
jgi:uncharacterized protein Usg